MECYQALAARGGRDTSGDYSRAIQSRLGKAVYDHVNAHAHDYVHAHVYSHDHEDAVDSIGGFWPSRAL